jgi:hypothetical protein
VHPGDATEKLLPQAHRAGLTCRIHFFGSRYREQGGTQARHQALFEKSSPFRWLVQGSFHIKGFNAS